MCEVRRLTLRRCHVDLFCVRSRNIVKNLFLSPSLQEAGKFVHSEESRCGIGFCWEAVALEKLSETALEK